MTSFSKCMEIDDQELKGTPWPLRREDLCCNLCAIVDTHGCLLVCVPFASGKTALVQLLHFHLRQDSIAYVILLLGCNVSWTQHWLKKTKCAMGYSNGK